MKREISQPRLRRSLLSQRSERGANPLWRFLLVTSGIASGIWWLFMVLAYATGSVKYDTPSPTTAEVVEVFLKTAFLPLTIIPSLSASGYLGSHWIEDRFAQLPQLLRRALHVGIWILGALFCGTISYVITSIIIEEQESFLESYLLFVLTMILPFVALTYVMTSIRRRSRQLQHQEQLLTSEFEAAHHVQQSLLPERDVRIHGFDISGAMSPAVEVGGDYYDYLTFADGSKGILVADAAGKGVPAALVMAKFQGMAQALSIHVASPNEFFVGLNDTLRTRLDRRSFITVGMLTIDYEDNCAFWRAGHNPLLCYRAATGEVETLCPPGLALGLAHGGALGESLQPDLFRLEEGDVVLLYSDGLTEAENGDREQFGEERLIAAMQEHCRNGDARAIRERIIDEQQRFATAPQATDDITIVVVKRV